MVAYRLVFLAGAAAALPLNINLGAYSPALVVGDGEISFGGNNDVNGLMSVLQGAAVSAANGVAANGAAQGAEAAAPAAAATPAAVEAVPAATGGETTTGTTATDASLNDQAHQIASLQGMGRAVLPREVEEASSVNKRDLAGFDRALRYAEAALVKGPKIQMGTGHGGSGVGIIVDNNPTAAARPGTGAGEAAHKRDVPASGRVKVTTMYVRSGVPASLQNENTMRARSEGADVEPRYETIEIAPAKRQTESSPDTIDAVNLNVAGDQGVTMTFVETIDEEEDA
ncbi:unnamed protein product [Discula destructiva]